MPKKTTSKAASAVNTAAADLEDIGVEVLPPEDSESRKDLKDKTSGRRATVAEPEIEPSEQDESDDLDDVDDLDDDVIDLDADDDATDDDATGDSATDDKSKGGSRVPAVARSYPPASSRTAPRDPLQIYLREISQFPLLKPDEEVELARRVRDHGDSEAAFRLVSSHLRLVVKIAMDFQRRWMQNQMDLIQEGNVGLMRAAQKFDPEKGIKFSYYAAFWIKAYILKYIMDNWRLVKIGTTQAQRKLFYNLNKEKQRLTALGFDPTSKVLAENLDVPEQQVREMEMRLNGADSSLDTPVGEESNTTRLDFLPALNTNIEDKLAQDEIAATVQKHLLTMEDSLSDKERDILRLRLLSDSPATLREIGDRYGITRERVRQLETRLLQKIRTHLSEQVVDFSRDWMFQSE